MWQTQSVWPVTTAHIVCCRLWTLCHTIQHRAVLIIFPLNLQTITITRMLSSRGQGVPPTKPEPNFLSGTLHFCHSFFHDVVFIQICQFCTLHWAKKHIYSVFQKCSVIQKYDKNEFRPGRTSAGGAHDAPSDSSIASKPRTDTRCRSNFGL